MAWAEAQNRVPQSGQRPKQMLADNGYCSEKNLAYLESAKKPKKKIEAYIATGRQKHGERRVCPRGPVYGELIS